MAQPWKVQHLDPDKRLPSCLKKILRTRVKEIFFYQASAVDGEDMEAVHDMRVAVRRMKAVLSIFQSCFKNKPLKKQTSGLNALLGALGSVRDSDIFIASLQAFRDAAAAEDRPALDLILNEEHSLRRAHRARLKKTLRTLNAKQFTKRFNDVVIE